ncbi:hypothetical protein FC52_GL000381 [Lactobacillus pasteurii DSM 23907 = CRBIP 24.76]|uniref:Uncharacterized protein n=1 Tax=Lactobacillus pasteurii DSM 23907 = CRBIP 24.76 TaxID=1423790 RepID=I7KLI4_9LACO|nr:hypothetical protein [Lactobacillus pasteurii]KRK08682.1 hypothetical protein FC52_GL000381 [Lactobacillus pasteurii DSM 23907 = CRBIP 24.76]TDG76494.1 hypothetical protein C5L33_001253 [Lactobacillus pasteurii]CCI85414.1 Putative uncharacterized protein [Lactobacillus pasteurii DSM 23907 = CRBIP 24.76]
MVEKRSEYQKKIRSEKRKSMLSNLTSAFSDKDQIDDQATEVEEKHRPLAGDGEADNFTDEKLQTEVDKSLILKKRLNSAILIVVILIALVLLALFKL